MAGTTSDKLAYLNETKDILESNLISKGIDVTSETTFRRMAEMVQEIISKPDAVELHLAERKYRYGDDRLVYIDEYGNPQEFLKPNSTEKTINIQANQIIGYYNDGSPKPQFTGDCNTVSSKYYNVTQGIVVYFVYVYGDFSIS